MAVKELAEPLKFKSYFFKNAIFRTAQRIIENHEIFFSKNTAESTTPQPIKKRDFLKSRKNMSTSASAENTTLTEKPLAFNKSSSTNSLNTMKVPGTAQYVSTTQKFKHLVLMKEIYPKRERRNRINDSSILSPISPFKKTHRSQSDATNLVPEPQEICAIAGKTVCRRPSTTDVCALRVNAVPSMTF
jgi:hypothetical protein